MIIQPTNSISQKSVLKNSIFFFLILAGILLMIYDFVHAADKCATIKKNIGLAETEQDIEKVEKDFSENPYSSKCAYYLGKKFYEIENLSKAKEYLLKAETTLQDSDPEFQDCYRLLFKVGIKNKSFDLSRLDTYYSKIKDNMTNEQREELKEDIKSEINKVLINYKKNPFTISYPEKAVQMAKSFEISDENLPAIKPKVDELTTLLSQQQNRKQVFEIFYKFKILETTGATVPSDLKSKNDNLNNYYNQFDLGKNADTYEKGLQHYKSALRFLTLAAGMDTENTKCYKKRAELIIALEAKIRQIQPETNQNISEKVSIIQIGIKDINNFRTQCSSILSIDNTLNILTNKTSILNVADKYYRGVINILGKNPDQLRNFYDNYHTDSGYNTWTDSAKHRLRRYYYDKAEKLLTTNPGNRREAVLKQISDAVDTFQALKSSRETSYGSLNINNELKNLYKILNLIDNKQPLTSIQAAATQLDSRIKQAWVTERIEAIRRRNQAEKDRNLASIQKQDRSSVRPDRVLSSYKKNLRSIPPVDLQISSVPESSSLHWTTLKDQAWKKFSQFRYQESKKSFEILANMKLKRSYEFRIRALFCNKLLSKVNEIQKYYKKNTCSKKKHDKLSITIRSWFNDHKELRDPPNWYPSFSPKEKHEAHLLALNWEAFGDCRYKNNNFNDAIENYEFALTYRNKNETNNIQEIKNKIQLAQRKQNKGWQGRRESQAPRTPQRSNKKQIQEKDSKYFIDTLKAKRDELGECKGIANKEKQKKVMELYDQLLKKISKLSEEDEDDPDINKYIREIYFRLRDCLSKPEQKRYDNNFRSFQNF
ncbi:hypothetical protein GMMP1_1240002 [Candidatus Magnetomoraceae bacterium gMMP-1]